ncbi:methane monooxygenase/ammonia monooxygenase subunit C [Nitrosomonas supralitoralis]|nr:methane monooxygenase/ammonia monooxygenase subunit C [Nitrosomonas supralitoralis]
MNQWGHAFRFTEKLFIAPLHWGFVILGWAGLCAGRVLPHKLSPVIFT